jgi:hypothetical protein
MRLSILKINLMKQFQAYGFSLLTVFGFIVLTTPFIKYPSAVKIVAQEPLHISYETLSGLNMVWDSVAALFTVPTDPREENAMIKSIVALSVAIVLLVQLSGIILKKKGVIFFTAIFLFAVFLINLMLLAKEGFVTIRWGYFVYLMIQAAIILLKPVSQDKHKILLIGTEVRNKE